MTERLELSDPYLTRFDAQVVSLRTHAGKPAAVLDRSAFYPEGGGQPADGGTLGGVPVLDVQLVEGEVLHVLERPVAIGPVEGQVDWTRRFDHMQQHHGQHLLSAMFDRIQAPTVSFHLGAETCTVDLAVPLARLDAATLAGVEAACNEVVFRDLPVSARDRTAEELAALELRKEALKGSRVVVVEGVDASPCGGTHPRRTGEVGAIAILRAQRWRDEVSRVEFVCGGRVLAALRESRAALTQAAEVLGCELPDVPAAAGRLGETAMARKRELAVLEKALAEAEAARLVAATPPGPIALVLDGPLATQPRLELVAYAVAALGRTALLGCVAGDRAALCFRRPAGAGPSMAELLREAALALGGKGGGNAEQAKGSGTDVAGLAAALAQVAARA